MKPSFPLFLICCLALVACRHDPPAGVAAAELTVVSAPLAAFDAAGGGGEVRFTTNRAWEVAVEMAAGGTTKDWCEVSPNRGEASKDGVSKDGAEIVVTVTARPNT